MKKSVAPLCLTMAAILFAGMALPGSGQTFDPGGMTTLKLRSQEERRQAPPDVAIAAWPTELLDAERTHYLNRATPTIMIFALANPKARALEQSWILFDLPEGVTLQAANGYLNWNSMTNSAIQRNGTNYTHYEIPCSVHPTTFPKGPGRGGVFQRSRPPALWLRTELAPGAKPGKVYYRVRYLEKGAAGPALSPESWVDVGVLPRIEATQPKLVASGVMGRFIFNVSQAPGMAGLLTAYVKQLGYTYYLNGPSQTNAPPGLARWVEGAVQNGFEIRTGQEIPAEIRYVAHAKEFKGAVAPWAIYRRHPWVVSNVFEKIRKDVADKQYSVLWSNWEPYAYINNGDYSEGSMKEFIAWSKLPYAEVKKGWPLATINAHTNTWKAFRNWELGQVTRALREELKQAGDAAGVDAGFAVGMSNDAIWGDLPDTAISVLPWGDLPYTLQTWSYYFVAHAEGKVPSTDRCGLVQVARSGGLAAWITSRFGGDHKLRLGCLYGWDQTGGAGFFLPEQLGFLHLSTVLAGMGNAQNYAEWPVWDGRYARQIALANTRIARWEEFILKGKRERTHLVAPVSPYPHIVPADVKFADQEPQGDVPKEQYLFSFEYQKDGQRLITVANTWDDGECFFKIRFPDLRADGKYRLSEPEFKRIFANAARDPFLTAEELGRGVLVHAGATRWAAFLLAPQSKAEPVEADLVLPDDVEKAMATRQTLLMEALKRKQGL